MIVVFRHLICYKVNVGVLSAAKASTTKAPQQQQQQKRKRKNGEGQKHVKRMWLWDELLSIIGFTVPCTEDFNL